jgi:propanol-preferring alcohol dehydrogenase
MPIPKPGPGQLLLRVSACGVCRTDLHVLDGELPDPRLPLVPGHEIIGYVAAMGQGVDSFSMGQRVGIPWLGSTCGHCRYCLQDRENLCDDAAFTGYQIPGGYAEFTLADARFCLPIHMSGTDLEIAPLMCAGLIGYRSYRMAGDARNLGLYGFGAAAHIIVQVALHEQRKVYAFVRPGDEQAREFALKMGASWAGYSDQPPPRELDAAILFAPAGALVPLGLRAIRKGGVVVCAGIHMSDIPSFPYSLLWGERRVVSVANLTRKDGREFLELASGMPIETAITPYPLEQANQALEDLRRGTLSGAAVLDIGGQSTGSG